MTEHNVNDNVNGYFSKKNNIVNVNDREYVIGKRPKDQRAHRIAKDLCVKFNNWQYYEFYLKIGYGLSENDIWKNYDIAKKKGRPPAKYFSFLCKVSLGKK